MLISSIVPVCMQCYTHKEEWTKTDYDIEVCGKIHAGTIVVQAHLKWGNLIMKWRMWLWSTRDSSSGQDTWQGSEQINEPM